MKKIVAAGISALMFAAGLVGIAAAPAQALTAVDMTGQAIKFAGGTIAGADGVPTVYRNVATINGIVIDAVVTPTLSAATLSNLDKDSDAVSAPPPSQPAGTLTAAQLLQTTINTTAANGYVELNFRFFQGGTYTTAGTGIQLQLNNVQVNSYDLDNMGASQFTEFKGFQTYNVSTNSTLTVSNQANGWTRFIDNSGGGYSDTTGSYTKGRVQANYAYVTDLNIRHGANGAAGNKYAIDFSGGYTWTDGSGGSKAAAVNNPYNTAPVTSNVAMYIATGNPYYFSSADYPYTDSDNNAFANLKIVTLPGSGTLEYLVGSTWTAVTAGQVISTADVNLGKLRFTGSAVTTWTFQVQDGLAYSNTGTFTANVVAGSQTITFANPGTKAPSVTFASAATASSGLTVTLTSNTPGVCTVSGLNIVTVATGTCSITATQPGSANFGAAQPVTQTFPVSTLTPQTINFAQPTGINVSTTFASGATATSGLTVTLVSLTPTVCTVSGLNIVTTAAGGVCQIQADQAGNGTYSPAPTVTRSFIVQTASVQSVQAITFAQPANIAISTATVTPGATASSGLTVSYASGTTSVCTISGSTINIVAVGDCTVTASQAGDANWSAAADVTRTFKVFGITTASIASGTTNSSYSQTFTASGGVGGGTFSTNSTLPAGLSLNASGVLSGTPTAAFNASITITYTEGGVTHSRTYTLVINQAALLTQTITFAQPANVARSTSTVTLAPTASSNLTVTLTSSTTNVCTVSGFLVTILAIGDCTLTASQAGNGVYGAATNVTRTFKVFGITSTSVTPGTVNSAYSQTLTQTGGVGGGTWNIVGLPAGLTYNASTGAISGTPTANGSFFLAITYTENGVSHQVGFTLVINAANAIAQTITFLQPNDVDLRSLTQGATVSSTSGLLVNLTSSTPNQCNVTYSVVNNAYTIVFVNSGVCTLTASQDGNSTYAAAVQVTRSFNILAIVTPSVGDGTVGASYNQSLAANGGVNGNYTWALRSGNLAGYGLTVNANGTITGIPTRMSALGISITVEVEDAGVTSTRDYTLIINDAVRSSQPQVTNLSPNRSLTTGGGNATITGENLCSVTSVVVDATKATVVSNNCQKIVFVIPAHAAGLVDIDVEVAAGKFKIARSFTYYNEFKPADNGQVGEKDVEITISGFAPGSPVLTAKMKTQIKNFIKKYPNYAHMYCTGVTMGPTVLAVDAALSRNRATNSCNYALTVNGKLTAKSQIGMQETVVGNQIRRVTIRLSNK